MNLPSTSTHTVLSDTVPASLAHLLLPIADSAPCGEDLSFSDEFDAIAYARRADDPSLDQGEWKTDIKVADWAKVKGSCLTLLEGRTKDLRLLGWLTEASSQLQGFEGMADGLFLCAQAIERYWPTIHPLPDDGDQEQRIGNLSWLLTQVEALALSRPLVDAGSGQRFALREIEVARTRHSVSDPFSNDAPVAGLTAELLAKALNTTSPAFLTGNVVQIKRAQAALAALQVVVDGLLGAEGPGFVAARQTLEDVAHAAERLARDSGVLAGGEMAINTDQGGIAAPTASTAQAGVTMGVSSQIQSRAQALGQLRLVAEYFRQTEPHSPVAYLADKAVQWGNMPLHVWLRTVLKDGGSLAHVEELLGLVPQDGGQQS
jgi:type VI secretion system protein ImpA